jgi:hypothetical protein
MIITWTPDLGTLPLPGIYRGVPMHVYRSWRYPSKSNLTDMRISPAQFAAKIRGLIPWPSSDSMTVGSLTGTLWVEQLEVGEASGWIQAPDSLPKTGKKRDEWAASVAPLEVYHPAQLMRAGSIAAALDGNARAVELRDGAEPELSIVWDCPHTGIRLKGRPDLVDFDRLTVPDLKTAMDIRPFAISNATSDYNYHWQLYLYTQALVCNGYGTMETWRQWLICARNSPEYGVACRPLGADAFDLARDEVTDVMWRLRSCLDANEWPADLLDESPISLPGYRYHYTPQHWEDLTP